MESEDARSRGGGLAKKVLMPVAATAVSAVAAYAGKRAPQLLEDKVMPRLREATSGTGELASGLAGRAKSAVDHGGDDDRSASSRPRRGRGGDELEQRRRARAEHRASRRKAARS